MLERLVAACATSERVTGIALALVIGVAALAPLGPLGGNRFHRDEAIYSSWGLDIALGRDMLVSGSPVDKPPLFFYVQALSFLIFGPTEVAARLPSLVASVASVMLIYGLGRSLYGRGVGLVAALLLAASPFTILFAPTAFTDPMMVAWVLAGCMAAVHGHWGWAGLFMGLGTITKQQGLFFLPLVLGLGLSSRSEFQMADLEGPTATADDSGVPNLVAQLTSFLVVFVLVIGVALAWDVARAREPGFLVQGLASYGGLWVSLETAWEHLLGFMSLLQYSTGSLVLNLVFLIGLPFLVVTDANSLRHRPAAVPSSVFAEGWPSRARADLILAAFIALFLAAHSLVAFAVWDR
jgi:hypothetical protein